MAAKLKWKRARGKMAIMSALGGSVGKAKQAEASQHGKMLWKRAAVKVKAEEAEGAKSEQKAAGVAGLWRKKAQATTEARAADMARERNEALFKAVAADDGAQVTMLLRAGAEVDATNRAGMTPVDLAVQRGLK